MKKQTLITILISSLLIAGSIFAFGYLNYRYKMTELKQNQFNKDREITQKAEQDKKEYIAKRSNECYSIYERERKEFNNVEGQYYDDANDKCIIRYTTHEYEGVDCKKVYGNILSMELECELGIFKKTF